MDASNEKLVLAFSFHLPQHALCTSSSCWKAAHVIFANFKAFILLACVILVRCDALSKESAMQADDTIPACICHCICSPRF